MIMFLIDHLWQSTVFAMIAAVLTMAFRNNGAHVRYWIWLAASIKFLVPFSFLFEAGRQVEWLTAPVEASVATTLVIQALSVPTLTNSSAPLTTSILGSEMDAYFASFEIRNTGQSDLTCKGYVWPERI
jgi:bla regulator protein blaR1